MASSRLSIRPPWTRATPISRSIITALVFLIVSVPASALRYVPGSPCEAKCSADQEGTIGEDVVCFDNSYQTTPGSNVRDCTTCLLNSTAVDTATGQTDVLWALFNLRYTLSECMFAYPQEIISISSPCQVTCALIKNATTYGIQESSGNATTDISPGLDFCNQGFGDTAINNCAFCYSFIDQQLFLANFLQALHIACRQPPVAGQTFYPDGVAIFNESAIAGPSPPSTNTGGKSGLTGWKLALVIALPIVGGALLFAATCFCCFRFTRKRRQKMAASGRMTRVHDGMVGAGVGTMHDSPRSARVSPKWDWHAGQHEPPTEMVSYPHDVRMGKQPSPGLGWVRTEDDEEGTPLNTAVPQNPDVGPGEGQQKDPYLHEQYFGVTHDGVGMGPGPQTYYAPHAENTRYSGDRGSWR